MGFTGVYWPYLYRGYFTLFITIVGAHLGPHLELLMKMPCQWLFGRWSPKRTFSTNTLWMPPTVTNVDWASAGLRTSPFRPFLQCAPLEFHRAFLCSFISSWFLGMLKIFWAQSFNSPFFGGLPNLSATSRADVLLRSLLLLPSCIICRIFSQVEYEMIIGPSVFTGNPGMVAQHAMFHQD